MLITTMRSCVKELESLTCLMESFASQLSQRRGYAQATKKFKAPVKATTTKKGAAEGKLEPRTAAAIEILMQYRQTPADEAATPVIQDKEFQQKTETYLRSKKEAQKQWELLSKERAELQFKALQSLPPDLRKLAEEPDLTLPPPNRKFFLDSPPLSYMDPKSASSGKQESTGKSSGSDAKEPKSKQARR